MIVFTAVILHREFSMSTGAVLMDWAHLAVPWKDGTDWLGFDKEPCAGTDDIHSSMNSSRKPASGKIYIIWDDFILFHCTLVTT